MGKMVQVALRGCAPQMVFCRKCLQHMGILQDSFFSTQPWYQFFQRDSEEEFMDLPKLWFREIRPSLGEDKKLDHI